MGLGWAYRGIHCGLSLSGISILIEGGRKLTVFKLEGIGNIARLCRSRDKKTSVYLSFTDREWLPAEMGWGLGKLPGSGLRRRVVFQVPALREPLLSPGW